MERHAMCNDCSIICVNSWKTCKENYLPQNEVLTESDTFLKFTVVYIFWAFFMLLNNFWDMIFKRLKCNKK